MGIEVRLLDWRCFLRLSACRCVSWREAYAFGIGPLRSVVLFCLPFSFEVVGCFARRYAPTFFCLDAIKKSTPQPQRYVSFHQTNRFHVPVCIQYSLPHVSSTARHTSFYHYLTGTACGHFNEDMFDDEIMTGFVTTVSRPAQNRRAACTHSQQANVGVSARDCVCCERSYFLYSPHLRTPIRQTQTPPTMVSTRLSLRLSVFGEPPRDQLCRKLSAPRLN